MMKINENDWRLTAYALGELDGDDLAVVEAAVGESAELRAIVEDVRATASLVSKELEAEPAIGLTDEQRARVTEHALTLEVDEQGAMAIDADDGGGMAKRSAAMTDAGGDAMPNSIRDNMPAPAAGGLGHGTQGAESVDAASGRSGLLGRIWVYSGAMAACLIVAVGGWQFFGPGLSRTRELSKVVGHRGSTTKGTGASVQIAFDPAASSRWPNPAVTDDGRLATNLPAERDKMFANVKTKVDGESEPLVIATSRRDYQKTLSINDAIGKTAPAADTIIHSATIATTHDGPLLFNAPAGEPVPAINMPNASREDIPQAQFNFSGRTTGGGETDLVALGYVVSRVSAPTDSNVASYAGGVSDGTAVACGWDSGVLCEGGFVGIATAPAGGRDPLDGWFMSISTRYHGGGLPEHPDSFQNDLSGIDPESPGVESYAPILENPFLLADQSPLSTFSIDVDTASYSNVRRFLNLGALPPADAVRIEELVNYFDYDYPQPAGDDPFSVDVAVAECPWDEGHRLARIGIKGMEYSADERPAANLVFLIDVSGSMRNANKLPLLKESLSMLVDELGGDDWVSMVVYAGASGLALPSTSCGNKDSIRSALNSLQSGGSTNGGAGIQLAYQIAEDNFIVGGVNRVILATDGDFNVGTTGHGGLTRLIEEKATGGVFLSVLGFGMGNLKDATLETLADKGNGNYAYIDTKNEARKVLVDQLTGTLVTIAKDVKIQVEFNPAEVAAYRLIGYENRMLAAQDFNNDKKDAGEIGAGHTVTAFYEIIPVGEEVDLPSVDLPSVDPLKYQAVASGETTEASTSGEMMTVKLRYKLPDEDESTLIEMPVVDGGGTFADSSDDFAFASAVASFGMLLRHSESCGDLTFEEVIEIAEGGIGDDVFGYRAEFVELVQKAAAVSDSGD
jgi:Ca-activated chloride channel homolog